MAEVSIPVDLFNPGQVFACLGFLEAADVLLGDAQGYFDWSDEADVQFSLKTSHKENPFSAVLEFLADCELTAVAPEESETFPNKPKIGSVKELPVKFSNNSKQVVLGHWGDSAESSGREPFKLYAGNRSALSIAKLMQKGITQLRKDRPQELIQEPFLPIPMGGSGRSKSRVGKGFNFDLQGGWTAIDIGYSPNDQKHQVSASPVVEILAAWGLENARPHPDEFKPRKVRYAAWGVYLPPMLARVALFAGISIMPMKRFHFEIGLSGKNKIITYSEQEIIHD